MSDEVVENEAEFESRLVHRLKVALPLLAGKITLQHQLRLKLGHQDIMIDGKRSGRKSARGRYDVVVNVDGRPTLLAELKAPGVDIVTEDVQQGLSYARLLSPMIPLLVITNGTITELRSTYDGALVELSEVAPAALQATLATAAQTAASDVDNAIRALLGSSSDVWHHVARLWSGKAIDALTGGVRDLRNPIASDFSISRSVCDEVRRQVADGKRVIALHGPALAGVTNALVQYVQADKAGPTLFIDDGVSDVLQHLANLLNRDVSANVTKDDIRSWFNSLKGIVQLTFVLDGLPKADFEELIEYANAGIIRVVLGINTDTLTRLSTIDGRSQASFFGRSVAPVELKSLSNDEFNAAARVLDTNFGARFLKGAEFVRSLRWPRMLRILAGTLPARPMPQTSVGIPQTVNAIVPIPSWSLLEQCDQAFAASPAVNHDFDMLAEAYLRDADKNWDNITWIVETWGRPSVSPEIISNILGESRVERMHKQGFLSWIETATLGPRVLVRIEEVLLVHVARNWARLLAESRDVDSMKRVLDRLIQIGGVIPGSEIAVAAAICIASNSNDRVVDAAIRTFVENEPEISRIREGAEIDVLTVKGPVRVHFGEGMDEVALGNTLPWMVLSHLLSRPMGSVDEREVSANLDLFAHLGRFPHLLYQPQPAELASVPEFHMHEVAGIGSFPCLSSGVIEPLLQSMLQIAHIYPEELLSLAHVALDDKDVCLAWRVLTVGMFCLDSATPAVHAAGMKVQEILSGWWGSALDSAIAESKGGGAPAP